MPKLRLVSRICFKVIKRFAKILSLSIQSSQSAFHEQHINGFGLDEEELFGLGDGDDGMDDVNMNGFDDIFGNDFDSKCFSHNWFECACS